MLKRDKLTRNEKDRLVEGVRDLINELAWEPSQLARHLGYPSPRVIHMILEGKGSMARAKLEEVLRLVENCTLPEEALASGKEAGECDLPPRIQQARDLSPRPITVVSTHADAQQDKSAAIPTVEAPAVKQERIEPAIPIFDVIQQAHAQLGHAVKTLDRGIAMANVLLAPGMKLFRTRVAEIQQTLEEALAMR